MELEYLNLTADAYRVQSVTGNQLVVKRQQNRYALNQTLIRLASSHNHQLIFSFLLAKIFKISSLDYQKYFKNFSRRRSFPKLLLDLNLVVAKNNPLDKNLLNPPPRFFKQLMLNLSPNCTLRCKYCYASSGRRPETATMSLALAKKAIDYVSKYCQGELNLGFIGEGEPTFDFKLLRQIVAYAKQKIKQVHVGPFSTNGVVTTTVADWLIKNVDNLQISCDGPAFIQNKYRPLLGNKNSSVFVEKTLKYLKKKKKDFRVRATVVEDTFGREKQIINYFLNLGVKRLLFGPLENIGASQKMVKLPGFKQKTAFNQPQYQAEYLKLSELQDEVGMKKYTPGLINLGNHVSCGIYTKSLFVLDPYGYVSACTRHTSPTDFKAYPFMKDFIIGQYNFPRQKFELDFAKIDRLKTTIDQQRKINRCLSCSFNAICGTGCLYQIGLKHGSLGYARPSCSEFDQEFLISIFKYFAQKYLVNKYPCLTLKHNRLFYTLLYTEFPLHLQTAAGSLKGNPYLYIDNFNHLTSLAQKIIFYKNSLPDLTFFLFKFGFAPGNVNLSSGKKLVSFFQTLQKNNVYFRISKPLPQAILGKNYDAICEQFRLPKQFKDCLELFLVANNRVIFPHSKKSAKTFSEFENRQEIYQSYYEQLPKNLAGQA